MAEQSAQHEDALLCRRLEGGSPAQLDDPGTAAGHVGLDAAPRFRGKANAVYGFARQDIREWNAVDRGSTLEYGHRLAMTAVGLAAGDAALLNPEMLGQRRLKPGAVQGGQRGDPAGGKSRVHQGGETGDIRGVEDDDDEFAVRTSLFDVETELFRNQAVVTGEVFARHPFFSGRAARTDHIGGAGKGFGDVRRPGDVRARKSTVVYFLGGPFQARFERIVHGHRAGGSRGQQGLCEI